MMVTARKYTGKYPNRIMQVSGIRGDDGKQKRGAIRVKTNDGKSFDLLAKDTGGAMPKLGDEISKYMPNPIKRVGLTDKKYINRRSQITGTTPKKRLIKRRTEHVISGKPEGYFPNPEKRASKFEMLKARTGILARACKLPDESQYPKIGTLLLNKVYGGRLQVTQVTTAGGGEADLSGTISSAEMEQWLNGAITIADARFKRA